METRQHSCNISAFAFYYGRQLVGRRVDKTTVVGQAVAKRSSSIMHIREMPTSEFRDKFSVAPMMDVTDRHFNHFARLVSRHAALWSEMLVDSTVLFNPGRVESHFGLMKDGRSNPIVLQLGGSDPEKLARATAFVKDAGYDEINLNCGCPSDKVSGKGCFGAALMKTPDLVGEITARMTAAAEGAVPISVKCRLGVDDDESYESLKNFIQVVSTRGGVTRFVIHARNAILKGLSPAQNRSVPPLKYDYVYRLRADFPHLIFTINGGLQGIEDAEEHLAKGMHGVMLGRAVRDRIWDVLGPVDYRIYGDKSTARSRREIIREYAQYCDLAREETGASATTLCKPFINAFHGEKNARLFRQVISEKSRHMPVSEVVEEAFQFLEEEALDRLPYEPKPQQISTAVQAEVRPSMHDKSVKPEDDIARVHKENVS